MFPGLKDLVHSGNKRITAFTGALHIHDKIADYEKVFDSAILCFFLCSCQSCEVRGKDIILLFLHLGP